MFGLMGRREGAIKISSSFFFTHTQNKTIAWRVCVCVCVCVTPERDKAKLVGKRAYHINEIRPRSWLRLIKKLFFYKTLPVCLCETRIIDFT